MNISRICRHLPRWLRRHKLAKVMLLISPDSRIQLVEFNGDAKVFADISDPFPRNYFLTRCFEPEFFSIATPFLSKGGVFFDVGANYGFCTFGMMACLREVNVEYHLFEANLEIYQVLLQSLTLHPKHTVFIHHCCVSENPGFSRLHVIRGDLGSSYIADDGSQGVENLILDNYIREHQIEEVHLLKIDIEGSEPLALKGALHSLSTGKVKTVYMEASTMNLSRTAFSVWDCFRLLKEAGFFLFYVKAVDFESGLADEREAFSLNVHGRPVKVSKVKNFPDQHQTDILAVHRSSGLLNKYKN